MKDKLLYLTIGLLVGVVVVQWTMPVGRASITSQNTGIAAIVGGLVLDENGTVWHLTAETEPRSFWIPYEGIEPLPVPVSEIKFWTAHQFITYSNVGWARGPGGWIDCGPWPGGTSVPTEQKSWGSTKSHYSGKDE